MTGNPDVLIIGGGLAGSCAALQLAKRGCKVSLVHQNNVEGQTASMVPLALYNPAAALRARKGWRATECHLALHELLDELTGYTGDDSFVSKNGVLRPCLDETMADNFRKSYETEGWPEGWVEWLEPKELHDRFPESEHRWGGLWVPVGMAIDTPVFLNGLHQMLRNKYGCTIIEKKVIRITEDASGSIARFEDRSSLPAPSILLATGAYLSQLSVTDHLKLHAVKGQTTEVAPFLPDSFKASVSSKGYISLHNNRVVIGSTYEHHFNELTPSKKSEVYLLKKVPRSFPAFNEDGLNVQDSWTGIRITTPERLPLIGKLPGRKTVCLATGFGSKGITYAPYCGKLIAAYLMVGTKLPHEVSVERQLPPTE